MPHDGIVPPPRSCQPRQERKSVLLRIIKLFLIETDPRPSADGLGLLKLERVGRKPIEPVKRDASKTDRCSCIGMCRGSGEGDGDQHS